MSPKYPRINTPGGKKVDQYQILEHSLTSESAMNPKYLLPLELALVFPLKRKG